MSGQLVLIRLSSSAPALRNRSSVVIYWEILKVLSFGSQGPTKLSASANVPFNRLPDYLGPLLSKGLVRKDQEGDRDVYAITPEGMAVLNDLDRVLPRLTG
jgi:predicted transcriptional regulator